MLEERIKQPLTGAEIARIKLDLWDDFDRSSAAKIERTPGSTILALGDSWFAYPGGFDLLDHLKDLGYRILRFARPGETLERLVHGSHDPSTFEPTPSLLDAGLAMLAHDQVDAVIVSAGIHDLCEALGVVLGRERPGLRITVLDEVLASFSSDLKRLCDRLRMVAPNTPVFVHGYGYFIPDGRADDTGPWMRPAFAAKGITDPAMRTAIVRQLVDAFNDMLEGIDAPNMRYADLRAGVTSEEWESELHPSRTAFRKLAQTLAGCITPHEVGRELPTSVEDLEQAEEAFFATNDMELGAAVIRRTASFELTDLHEAFTAADLPTDNLGFSVGDLTTWSGAFSSPGARILALDAAGKSAQTIAQQLAVAANLAKSRGKRLRPIGHHRSELAGGSREPLHNWSPLHLDRDGDDDVVHVSFEKLVGEPDFDEDLKQVRVLAGTTVEALAKAAHAKGFTLPAIPAPGVLSIGGALAIGAHGSLIAASDGIDWPGTISATVVAATAIVWDETQNVYVAKTFGKADDELAFVALGLGRVLVVEVTLRLQDDYLVGTEFIQEPATSFFQQSPPFAAGSLGDRLARGQNIEVLAFRTPPNRDPIVHAITWTRKQGPIGDWPGMSFLNDMVRVKSSLVNCVSAVKWGVVARRARKKAEDFVGKTSAGPAASQRLYVTSDTLRVEPLGWALVLPRAHVPMAAFMAYWRSHQLLRDFMVSHYAHHHVAFELRFASLDPVAGPWLSVAAPVPGQTTANHVVMWVNILALQTPATRKHRAPYLAAFERFLLEKADKHGWIARPEWSKGWAYANSGAWQWSASQLRGRLQAGWPNGWNAARKLARRLDPHGVFTTSFHDLLLPPP